MASDSSSSADYGTVYYRSKDSIKNLKVKVCLQKVTSASLVPQAVLEENLCSQSSGTEMRQVRKQQELMSQKEEEDFVFVWQDKIFSQREFDTYKHENNCESVIDKKYHQQIIHQSERPTKRLFSYVNHDKFTNQKEALQNMTTSPNEKPTPLAEKVSNVRRRRTAASRLLENGPITPKVNIVDYSPSTESQRRNHVIVTPEQTMYIMADLCPRDRESTADDEYVLCTIKVDANGVITMKPNFNNNSRPYRIETDSLGKEVYQYTLECVSANMTSTERLREEKMYKELYSRHSQYLSSLVGTEFELPPPGVLRVVLYGEILSAWNFEYDNLFVRYIISVPSRDKGWLVESSSQLSGVTQTCVTKVEGKDNVAHFSFPFESEMHYKAPPGVESEDDEDKMLSTWPKIFFEICSLDGWNRFRSEGYCALVLPNTPGEHVVTLNCWRPLGPSMISNLRRFFIGGSPELEDLSYVHIPSSFQGSRMSRYGFKTESTGCLKVKINVLLQSQSFCFSATKRREKKRDATLMTQLGPAVDYTQIRAIVESFTKAHERMKQAREMAVKNLQDLSLYDADATATETIGY